MGINIDYTRIAEALAKNIELDDLAKSNISKEERDFLNNLNVNISDDIYRAALSKIEADTPLERKAVIEELQKFTNRIKELVPDQNEFSAIISGLFQSALSVKKPEELLRLFGDKITELENSDNKKSEEDKDLERLVFKNTSYAEQMDDSDYERLVEVLASNPTKYKPSISYNGSSTTFSFEYNGKSYSITVNKTIDTSSIEKAVADSIPKTAADLEKVIQSFAKGELLWGDLVSKLVPFGFTEEEIREAAKYNYKNDGYIITLKFDDKEYSFNCNIGGANDGTGEQNVGETYALLKPNDVKSQGLTEEQIAKYFVEAIVIDGEVKYYTKNKITWGELGVSTTLSISALKAALRKEEQFKHLTELANEIITELTDKYALTYEEVRLLREYLQTGDARTAINNLAGKSDNSIKLQIKSLAEAYITETIKSDGGSRGSGNVDGTNSSNQSSATELTDAQKATINSVCTDIASKAGLSTAEKTELINLVEQNVSAYSNTSNDTFNNIVEKEAIKVAAEIMGKRDGSVNGTDLDDLVSNIENHSINALSDLKAAFNKGLVDVKIKREGTTNDYSVSVLSKDGEVLCSEIYHKNDLTKAGFNIQEEDRDGNVSIDRTGNNTQNVTDNQKNSYLLELCSLAMSSVSNNDVNITGLRYEQAMKLYNELKTHFNSKTYTNLDTFKKDARDKAKELGKKYVDENAKSSNSRGTTSTYNEVASAKFGHLMGQLYNILKNNGFSHEEPDFTSDSTKVTIRIKTKNGIDAGELVITKDSITYNGNNNLLKALLPQIRAEYRTV